MPLPAAVAQAAGIARDGVLGEAGRPLAIRVDDGRADTHPDQRPCGCRGGRGGGGCGGSSQPRQPRLATLGERVMGTGPDHMRASRARQPEGVGPTTLRRKRSPASTFWSIRAYGSGLAEGPSCH